MSYLFKIGHCQHVEIQLKCPKIVSKLFRDPIEEFVKP